MQQKQDPPDKQPHWKCARCGYMLQAAAPPAQCPSCREHCEFSDVSCYTPECGFQGMDPRVA
ncbi:MAG: hypothetical protein C4520_19500 [Candidatus Abyssobacteria bacterium SURF_5]|uniref:Rubrerythrin rubredoxin-like domain-containing protein n=1 Tax=Abyssobacteria bacterium (strain SURF_5) TaxID=2093360 RepID=A0A3A4NL70_ABYX5|nr:MAG: hypothetical protein C4520_19500 [Candidatus Abyssubacteria bacterium SURF_5]